MIMSRCNDEVKCKQQVIVIRTIFLLILFVVGVECSDKKQLEKRDVHRIVIIPARHRNNKKRPTKGGAHTHYFNSPDLQIQPTLYPNGLNQISYHNKMKLPSKNRYHEMQLPEHHSFQDSFLDGTATIHVSNSQNGWKPISGKYNQHHPHTSKYTFIPDSSSTASSNNVAYISSTTTSRRPSSSQHKTKKINRSKSRFSTTGQPRKKSLADIIELTTAFPQALPPVQTYLNIMTDLHQTADQSQDYLYQNILVRPRLKKITTISTTTHTPKTTKITRKSTTIKPYEVYENVEENFPSSVIAGESGEKVQYYGTRVRARRPARPKITTK